jgi:hypothetical protein
MNLTISFAVEIDGDDRDPGREATHGAAEVG